MRPNLFRKEFICLSATVNGIDNEGCSSTEEETSEWTYVSGIFIGESGYGMGF